jgi:LCP family protein required for cell wall assembly
LKKIKFPQFIKYTLLVGVVFIAFFGMGIGLVSLLWPDTTISTASSDANTTIEDTKRVNILLLGIDARNGETISRSDTIILASIDPELKRVAMVSIPRDTKISGSSAGGMDKINAANVIGGPQLAVSKVEELMGEKIDYYIEVDFKGFKQIIDTVGGVDINVDQKMYKPSEGINLKPGQQRLDGDGALAFVRYRDYTR